MSEDTYTTILDWLVNDAGDAAPRWAELVNAMGDMRGPAPRRIAENLTSIDLSAWSDNDREILWQAIRGVLSNHRSFPDAHWALPPEVLDALARAYPAFRPQDPIRAVAWLFGSHVELPEGRRENWEEFQHRVDEERAAALGQIWTQGTMDSVLELAMAVEYPWVVGVALWDSGAASNPTATLRELAQRGSDLDRAVARAYMLRALDGKDFEDARTMWSSSDVQSLPADWAVLVLLAAPFATGTWELIDGVDPTVARLYWKEVSLLGRGQLDEAAVVRVGQNLEAHGEYARAIDFLSMYRDHATPDLVLSVLEGATSPENGADMPWHQLTHDVGTLIGLLQQADVDLHRVATIEWQFLPLVDRTDLRPVALNRQLADSPRFFIDVLSLVYRAEGEEPREEVTATEQMRAERAFELLRGWRLLPGMSPASNELSEERLFEWVVEARQLAGDVGRKGIGDFVIGQLLSASPPGADGEWPHEAVRSVLESVGTERLIDGFTNGIFNSRGVFFRPPGGEPERVLQAKYERYADALAGRWPITAAALRRVADSYGRDAQREDVRAELEGLE